MSIAEEKDKARGRFVLPI